MYPKNVFVGILAAGCFVAASVVAPNVGHAQADPRVTKSMEGLKSMTAKLGAPKLEGSEAVGGKDAPALYFGTTKINNNFDVVDVVGKEDGKGMTATLFARGGDEYIRVSTNVPKPDGGGRAVGKLGADAELVRGTRTTAQPMKATLRARMSHGRQSRLSKAYFTSRVEK